MITKTDNGHLIAKLDLRRHFLRKYHAGDPANLLDCCQGSGVIWSHLRREFPVASYWGDPMNIAHVPFSRTTVRRALTGKWRGFTGV